MKVRATAICYNRYCGTTLQKRSLSFNNRVENPDSDGTAQFIIPISYLKQKRYYWPLLDSLFIISQVTKNNT